MVTPKGLKSGHKEPEDILLSILPGMLTILQAHHHDDEDAAAAATTTTTHFSMSIILIFP